MEFAEVTGASRREIFPKKKIVAVKLILWIANVVLRYLRQDNRVPLQVRPISSCVTSYSLFYHVGERDEKEELSFQKRKGITEVLVASL